MTTQPPLEQLDVLIVGAGISGIGAARYLRHGHPDKTFAVLEARDSIGGTWDLFRYPGIRSDSDLYTFGYEFKPWRDRETIASAPQILKYLHETVEENRLADHIRFGHRVTAAEWSSQTARWLVRVESPTPEGPVERQISARWIFSAGGYYRYDEGYTPVFEGRDRFAGTIVHPQHWPEDLDYRGKKVVVIGSGATAVTLVPALAETAEHVTLLQRTPTYIMPVPKRDPIANLLKRVFSEERAHAMIRAQYVATGRLFWNFTQRFPRLARRLIRRANVKALPPGYPVDLHFKPPYNPWEQRLCAVPDGDLFKAISDGRASMVTDRIETFSETGIELVSGRHLDADVIVTATGLNLQIAGGIALSVDGNPIDFAETVIYRGMMATGVPNFAIAVGYTNASWTLKIGLLCEYFVDLLRHMDERGYDAVWPEADPAMPTRPLLDFGAGYVQRSLHELPKQGPAAPWLMSKDYVEDRRLLRGGRIADEYLHFSRARDAARKRREPVA
ncbi:putative FAD-containing monooxygenase EthA [Nocardia nova SH22a]|uniref:Putative FAD-containing monooxygenase EthA n=1 Tax=Nocardia nova SH22a TaxID=1415166 RepID=W5THL9_9NOCA|nr:NAD(P)/FAD-dependent oxidoreductase [Nocardia nova]AHH18468.1 putative FAD-containing monooxygenase EthA [Nocardia nova SH22a]